MNYATKEKTKAALLKTIELKICENVGLPHIT